MPRIVIDTSTLVGAVLHAGSVPHRAWLRAQESYDILASRETFFEIETVLCRKRLSRYIDPITRGQFLALYRNTVAWIEISPSNTFTVEPCYRDPKDNMFLTLAHVGQTDLIVSSDNDLLVLHPWHGIAIHTPAQFLTQFAVED